MTIASEHAQRPPRCTVCRRPLVLTWDSGLARWVCLVHSSRGVPFDHRGVVRNADHTPQP